MEFRWLSPLVPLSFPLGDPVQIRTFDYNGLSQLRSATNIESGTIDYLYDPNGNLVKRTDDRGTITDYTYDELNRPTTTSMIGICQGWMQAS